jgi:uracil DNA glycosylase
MYNPKWNIDTAELNSVMDIIKDIDYTPKNPLEFLHLDPDNFKIIILGDNPYNDTCECRKHLRDTGYAFKVRSCGIVPNVVKNIRQELFNSIGVINDEFDFPGVLMLNTSLTVEKNKFHKNLWFGFLSKLLNALPQKTLFLIWGRQAEEFSFYISNSFTKLKSNPNIKKEFIGCNHFSKARKITGLKFTSELNFIV